MTLATFSAFLLAALVLAFTPGPGITYVVARTVAGGRAEGLASCLGTAFGGLLHVIAAALGLSVVIAQSAAVFNTLKWLGVAYLVYLGVRLLRQAREGGAALALPAVAAQGARRAFREGILVEALNVKTALFFLAFLPQFVSAESALLPQLVLLGTIVVTLNTTADVIAVLAADRFVALGSAHARRTRLLQRISGGTMLVLAAWLATARRQAAV
ncbi:MAG: LysE family translocator [Casimicrobiaceae bacterium]|nr:LysE family translocator [Casimicrobiaceae bacterium]MCX8098690.1 LysE family translocator [Casimicrobiaceae bacterium]MDW8312129.1 LysE family translocator [Burkholderiales bacterium]